MDILSKKKAPSYTFNVWPYVVLLQNDVNLQSLYKEYHLDLNIFVSVAYTDEVFIHNL